MQVTLDAELQAQRRKNSEDLAKIYGGSQKVEVDEAGTIVVSAGSYPIPIPTIRTKVKVR
ncbi:MAG: hypothetical protein GH144_02620 [Clostridia bacterium]|jgi:hypothetical protein|nr:hypothetical protein [Clostridia bacterium]